MAFVVALGLDTSGQKRVLGFWEGATKNAEVGQELLADLERRGLKHSAEVLFIIDGGKGTSKALKDRYGRKLLVQRCTLHKDRNLQGASAQETPRRSAPPLSGGNRSGVAVSAGLVVLGGVHTSSAFTQCKSYPHDKPLQLDLGGMNEEDLGAGARATNMQVLVVSRQVASPLFRLSRTTFLQLPRLNRHLPASPFHGLLVDILSHEARLCAPGGRCQGSWGA